jgi:uncharacterized protein YutE (UPF0331/DUF86 family)
MSPGRISRAIVADKVALVRRMVDAVATLPLADLQAFRADARMVAAGESFLRRALEALLDLGRHVLAKGFGRAPAEYADVARQLGQVHVLAPDVAERFILMARYRNRMVHFYDEVTEAEFYALLTEHIGDFERVIAAINLWITQHPTRLSDRDEQ